MKSSIEPGTKESAMEVMDMKNASEYLKISKSCLYQKTSRREMPFCKPKGSKKLYFIKRELDEWILQGRVKPIEEEIMIAFSERRSQND